MPTVARVWIVMGMLWLLAAFGWQSWIAWSEGIPWPAGHAFVAWLHLYLVGWLLQSVLGVAFWLFPLRVRGRRPDPRPAWLAWVLLNLGILLRLGSETQPVVSSSYLVATGSQALGVTVMAIALLGRVRGRPTVPSRKEERR